MNWRCTRMVLPACLAACGGSPPLGPVSSATGGTTQPTAVARAASILPAASTSSAPSASSSVRAAPKEPPVRPAQLQAEPLALPGAVGPVSLDYLFYEAKRARVWVPAGGTGSVAVYDIAGHSFSQVGGFKTAEREAHGKKRVLGPSAGAIGEGFAYIGNRATQEVCAIELETLKSSSCLKLAAATDGVEYVSLTHEVWVTTPHVQSLVLLDASKPGSLKQKATLKLAGDPEGYAVDEARSVFLTNLEDKGSTLVIDLVTHAVNDTWHAGCSSDGPRGIALDSARSLAFVACTDHVQALDMAHAGAPLGKLDTGEGLDNIDYVASTGLLYAAAGKAARLTVAHVGDHGDFTIVATGETAAGARNAVADANGNAFVADPQAGRLLLLRAAQR